MSLRTITNSAEFMAWAREVNQGLHTPAKIADWQDVYAHSKRGVLDSLINNSDVDLRLIMCSIYNTMGYDEVEHMLQVRAAFKVQVQINKEYEELDRKTAKAEEDLNRQRLELLQREDRLKNAVKSINKRVEKWRKVYDRALFHIKALEETNESQKQAVQDAKKYRKIKALLV